MSGFSLGSRLLDALFPPRCVSCGASGALLCARCLAGMRALDPPLCSTCGRSLADEGGRVRPDTTLCAICAAGDGPAHLDGLRAACVYEGAARQAILALKFRGQRRLARPLADLLAAGYTREGLIADLIVPVRLHRGRRRQRGFDQAELLARALGDRLGLDVRADVLVRHRATAPQTTLPRDQRRANVAGAFTLASLDAVRTLAGRRILLVDDVTTTGSTLDDAASALREAGPAAIWGLAVARPGLHPQDDTPGAGATARTTRGAGRSRARG